jgi:hypothetical protein
VQRHRLHTDPPAIRRELLREQVEPLSRPREYVGASPRGLGRERAARSPARSRGQRGAAAWYEELRERYRPDRLRVLLVAESPPDPGGGERRFFYSATLRADNLYRGIAKALYGERSDVDITDKPSVLEHLQREGLWLIDAAEEPVNKLGSAARARAIAAGVPRLVERCVELAPELGFIICHGKVYAGSAEPLHGAGVRVLHPESLPFPLGNWRAQFVEGFRRALLGAVPDLGERLAHVIPDEEIAQWTATPISALQGQTPIEAILAGNERAVLAVVADLESPGAS